MSVVYRTVTTFITDRFFHISSNRAVRVSSSLNHLLFFTSAPFTPLTAQTERDERSDRSWSFMFHGEDFFLMKDLYLRQSFNLSVSVSDFCFCYIFWCLILYFIVFHEICLIQKVQSGVWMIYVWIIHLNWTRFLTLRLSKQFPS